MIRYKYIIQNTNKNMLIKDMWNGIPGEKYKYNYLFKHIFSLLYLILQQILEFIENQLRSSVASTYFTHIKKSYVSFA